MPSPIGHAMAGLITAWVGEIARGRVRETPGTDRDSSLPRDAPRRTISERLAGCVTPLAVACAVLAVSPDFDNFFHTHRTWSHSLGAAVLVWVVVAVVAWRWRLPVSGTAAICSAAYASHILLDWLGKDEGLNGGLMALWPLSTQFYKSGANLFWELAVHPRANIFQLAVRNIPAFAREIAILAPFLVLTWLVRVKTSAGLTSEVTRRDKAA